MLRQTHMPTLQSSAWMFSKRKSPASQNTMAPDKLVLFQLVNFMLRTSAYTEGEQFPSVRSAMAMDAAVPSHTAVGTAFHATSSPTISSRLRKFGNDGNRTPSSVIAPLICMRQIPSDAFEPMRDIYSRARPTDTDA